jgi:hypothetical protein
VNPERHSLGRPKTRVVQHGEECVQMIAPAALRTDRIEQLPDLPRAGNYAPVNGLSDLRDRPLNLINGIGWQEPALNGVAQRVVQDRSFAVNGGDRRRSPIHTKRKGVKGLADRRHISQRTDRKRCFSQPGQRCRNILRWSDRLMSKTESPAIQRTAE